MDTRRSALSILLAMLLLLGVGCATKDTSVPMSDQTGSAAGISWGIPQGWTVQGERMMRVATYVIEATGGDEENGECAVFFFGSEQGGDVRMNISRWSGQFEGSPAAEESTEEINGVRVTNVKIAGTYLAPGGMTMESTATKEGFVLLGAIVEAPEGNVFFKFTGPEATVLGAEGAFKAMVGTLTTE